MLTMHIAAHRRRSRVRHDLDSGFTLIELLVVVIIIGILAAIAIPVYLGVQNSSKDAGVQSDVRNLKTASVAVLANSGTPVVAAKTTWSASGTVLPTTLTQAGATLGANTTSLTYYPASTGTSYCVLAISKTGNSFAVTDSTGVAKGSCTTAGVYSATVVTTAP